MRIILIFVLALGNLAFGEDQSLKKSISYSSLLKKSKQHQDTQRKIEQSSQAYELGQGVVFSPWHSNWELSLESSKMEESFTSGLNTEGRILPLNAKWGQQTPYGLSLDASYRRVLNKPLLSNFITMEDLSLSLNFSLYSDFLGRRSRKIIGLQDSSKKWMLEKEHLNFCAQTYRAYLEWASLQEQKVILLQREALMKNIYRKVRQASQRGAVSKVNRASFKSDLVQIEIQKLDLVGKLKEAQTQLETLTYVDLAQSIPKSLRVPQRHSFQKGKSFKIKQLEFELDQEKARLEKLKLSSFKDIKLYGRIGNRNFTQNTIGIRGETLDQTVGLSLTWQFGGEERRSQDLTQLKVQMKRQALQDQILKEQKEFLLLTKELDKILDSYGELAQVQRSTQSMQKEVGRQFLLGRLGYTEFLSRHSQIFSLKESLLRLKKRYAQSALRVTELVGDSKAVCGFQG